jgi:hypothetical protein
MKDSVILCDMCRSVIVDTLHPKLKIPIDRRCEGSDCETIVEYRELDACAKCMVFMIEDLFSSWTDDRRANWIQIQKAID